MSKKHNARSAAAIILKKMLIDGQSLNQTIPLYSETLAPEEQGLCKAICFGVCRFYRTLSTDIDALLEKPLRNKDYDIYALLLIGAYQLDKMRTPEYAAIDSCVSASKMLKKDWAKGLINAVLRKYQKQTEKPSVNDEKAATEHPDWLVGKIRKMWPDHSEAIFAQNNLEPPLCLRINEAKITRADYCKLLTEQGIAIKEGVISSSAVYLPEKGVNITALPYFAEGYFSVQDEAPQLAAFLLDAQADDKVLDACAAPGGKTCHILEHTPKVASVTAVDMDASRLVRVEENLQRLQLQAQCITADILATDDWWDGQGFDKILADVPCSATGVIRRHPDIKWLRKPDDIQQLAALQLEMLNTLWTCLKPGGKLLYATCSVLTQENTKVINAFLRQQSDAKHLSLDSDDRGFGPSAIQCDVGVQFLPQANSHDGFYYALLEKESV
ncbi:MAG: 16S rRNA (cytosine(967)-C(5))-methyltransferase RsmB [Pseudomonadales bacterium]|nr:16S rRNA (cytosine(967)-C(5))-methyltransferase RsmB [Pseudomonadales bacterium]